MSTHVLPRVGSLRLLALSVATALVASVSAPVANAATAPSATFTSPASGATVASSSSTNTITWTESDGGSPITSRTLTQESGKVVTPGTCSGVTWVTAWSGNYTSPFTTTGYASGYCYRYTLDLANAIGPGTTASSGDLIVSGASATFTSPAPATTVISNNSTNTITWTEDGGGSAIIKRTLTQRYGKAVKPNTCAGVSWVVAWSGSYTSPFTTSGFAMGYCYRWTLTITNGGGFVATTNSGHLLVQPPGNPTVAFTSPSAGSTLQTTNTTNTITWTEADGGSAITGRTLTEQYGKVVSAGTCAGATWVTAWSGTYTSPFTTGGFTPGYCYRWTVTLTNASGFTGSGSSGSLLVQPGGSPTANFTSPAAGQTLKTTNTTNTITWTETDGGSAITSRVLTQRLGRVVTPGTCNGVHWVNAWSGSYTSPFTTGGFAAGYCYRWTVTLTNAGGLTGSASSGVLLVN